VNAPTVITIGCSPRLEQRCGRAVATLGALFHRGALENAATAVAEQRPLVIVIPQDIYEFDPNEFDALARDVGASLLRVDDDVSEPMLEMLLGPALEAGVERRRRQGVPVAALDDPRAPRHSAARLRSWADLEAPPPSSRSSQA
jgi:hypothetical protein